MQINIILCTCFYKKFMRVDIDRDQYGRWENYSLGARDQFFTEQWLLSRPVTLRKGSFSSEFLDNGIELPAEIQELFSYSYNQEQKFNLSDDKNSKVGISDREDWSDFQKSIYSDIYGDMLLLMVEVIQFLNFTYALPVWWMMRISLKGGDLIELRRTNQWWDILSDIPDARLWDKLEWSALFIHPTGSIVLIKNTDGLKEYSRNCREAGSAIYMINSESVFNRMWHKWSDYRTIGNRCRPHQRDDMYRCIGWFESIEYIPYVSHLEQNVSRLEQIKSKVRKLLSRPLLSQKSN